MRIRQGRDASLDTWDRGQARAPTNELPHLAATGQARRDDARLWVGLGAALCARRCSRPFPRNRDVSTRRADSRRATAHANAFLPTCPLRNRSQGGALATRCRGSAEDSAPHPRLGVAARRRRGDRGRPDCSRGALSRPRSTQSAQARSRVSRRHGSALVGLRARPRRSPACAVDAVVARPTASSRSAAA
jgi:hypothetical protein